MPTKVYCVKCRKKTKNEGKGKVRITKNGRDQYCTTCEVCGTKKCQFLPQDYDDDDYD